MNRLIYTCYSADAMRFSRDEDTPKPNVILVKADDLDWVDVGYNGSKMIKTPHLDNIVAGHTRTTLDCRKHESPRSAIRKTAKYRLSRKISGVPEWGTRAW